MPFTSGESASTVLGVKDFVTDGSLASANQSNLPLPSGLAFDSSGNLWVSDSTANRIVEFKAPFTNGENESIVLGQPSFTTQSSPDDTANQTDLNSPRGITFDSSGNLWVADNGYDRVVEFNAPFTNGEQESMVIGQTNFTTGVQNIPGCPFSCTAQTSPNSLNGPSALAFDSSGNLWVADSHGGRVLKFNSPLSSGDSANLGLGVVDLNTVPGLFCIEGGPYCIGFPDALAFDKSGSLWVNDDTNGRVLEFIQPFSTNESATTVIGQPDFNTISPIAGPSAFNVSQSNMYGNDGVAFDPNGNLWVSDGGDNRVLEFSSSVAGSPTTSSSLSTFSSSSSSTPVSTSSTAASPTTTTQQPTTQSTTSVSVTTPASSSSSASSSTSISLNYLAVIAVVVLVMATTFVVVMRHKQSTE